MHLQRAGTVHRFRETAAYGNAENTTNETSSRIKIVKSYEKYLVFGRTLRFWMRFFLYNLTMVDDQSEIRRYNFPKERANKH